MTDTDRFIRNQLTALKELGLCAEALAREEALLRSGLAASGLLEKFLAARQPVPAARGTKGGQKNGGENRRAR